MEYNSVYFNETSVEKALMELADRMAATATTVGQSSMDYEMFIQARDEFKSALHSHCISDT